MDTYKQRYLALRTSWKDYYETQQRLRKDRRLIYIVSCLLCLVAGFFAGMIVIYPKEHVVVSVEAPRSEPEAKPELISL